jgi:tetratricopeptide (TPR) repeat protein
MQNKRNLLILLIALGACAIVLFLWLPRLPSSALEKQSMPVDQDSLKLQQAIELVNGPNPMQGIGILRELIAKDSTNIEAQYWLGVFSVRSEQYEKALNRFKTVLNLDPQYLAAWIDLGGVYMRLDSTGRALECFNKGVEIDSTNNFALLFGAQTMEKMGMLKEAKARYAQLLRHNEDTVVQKRIHQFIDTLDKKLKP